MHIVRLSAPLTRVDGRQYPAGEYLCEDLTAMELAIEAPRGTAQVDPWFKSGLASAVLDHGIECGVKSALLISNGGFGDMILGGPAFRAWATKWPDIKLTVACRERSHVVLHHLPYRPALIDYPVPMNVVGQHDIILTTEHLQEDPTLAAGRHAMDIKAEVLRVGPLIGDARKVDYIVTTDEASWAKDAYPRFGERKRIGIQLAASAPLRTYHPQRMEQVIGGLYEKGHEVFLFGSPGSLKADVIAPKHRDRIRNLTTDKLTFRESAAVVTTCDAMFCPDSALVHVAGALNIPTVAVFATVHWSMRTSQYPSVRVLQSNIGCEFAPCGFHPRGPIQQVKGAPCETLKHCVPLNSIEPERIISEIEKKLSQK